MSKNEQSQEQNLNVESDKKLEETNCDWYCPPKDAGQILHDPWAFKKVKVLSYKGKVTQVICQFLVDEKCTSSDRPVGKDRCYILGPKRSVAAVAPKHASMKKGPGSNRSNF